MIDEGLRLWQQPFDQDDLDDIEAGITTSEQAKDYLLVWSKQNPARFNVLKDSVETMQAVIAKDDNDPLEILTRQGLQLLGEDKIFINQCLLRWPMSRREGVLTQYADVWLDAAKSEPIAHKKANQGRKAANAWLWKAI